MTARLAPVLAAFAVVLALLATGLRPDAFYVGDPGVKLVSARNALQHPTRPLEIPLPRIGPDDAPYIENFFAAHDDHSHAITSEFFPLLSAPLLALFGLRGLYVLPALGFVGTLAACAWLASVLDTRRSVALVASAAALGTPFLFYGLEFWEHTPALALGVAGAALLLDASRRRPGQHAAAGAALGAGVLSGAAIVLRPEAACFFAAVLIASRTLVHRPTWRTLGLAVGGAGLAVVPLELYTVVHFGALVPGHVGTNAGLIGAGWTAERVQFAQEWLLPSLWNRAGPRQPASLWSVAPIAVVALLSLVQHEERDERPFLWLVAVITTLLVFVVAPNEGGGQWGPRYLLFAYVPLVLCATDLVEYRRGGWTRPALLLLLLLACVWVQRAAYRQLRGTKSTYGRVVDFVKTTTTTDTFLVTDVWWIDQLAASALDAQHVLVVADAPTGAGVVKRLSDRTVPSLTVIRSTEEGGDADSWSAPTCYFEEARDELPVRGLVAIKLRHRCGYKP